MHFLHSWETFETTGRVVTQYCTRCGKTRVRVRAH